jgi:hypothetical protein
MASARGHEPRENSLLFSLNELRELESVRLQEEREAQRVAEEQRLRAEQEAIARAHQAEQARLREQREATLRLEQAREAADREARLRVEHAAVIERQRHHAALEQQRMLEELAIRREAVARQRPVWMVAIMSAALMAAVAMTAFALVKRSESLTARTETAKAKDAARDAQGHSEQVRLELERIGHDASETARQIEAALAEVKRAQTTAERDASRKRLEGLRTKQAELRARMDKAKADAERKLREAGIQISNDCLNGVLGKTGCR